MVLTKVEHQNVNLVLLVQLVKVGRRIVPLVVKVMNLLLIIKLATNVKETPIALSIEVAACLVLCLPTQLITQQDVLLMMK
jgi:hypothetical protein